MHSDDRNRYVMPVFSPKWAFNIVLLDAAPLRRRSSMHGDIEKEKYENFL